MTKQYKKRNFFKVKWLKEIFYICIIYMNQNFDKFIKIYQSIFLNNSRDKTNI